jgi:hypothetical protein
LLSDLSRTIAKQIWCVRRLDGFYVKGSRRDSFRQRSPRGSGNLWRSKQRNPAVNDFFAQAQSGLLSVTGDPVAAKQMALQTLDNLRFQQSSTLASLRRRKGRAHRRGVARSALALVQRPPTATK